MATKKSEVEAALVDAKKALEGSDNNAIKSATDKLAEVSQALGAALYAAGAAAGASEGASQSTPEDGVEDAEIVEEK
jgi:molecular chaperone DnaK